ncbi:hypothetical protein [Nocardia carnea]|uniref:hypothetical protein n=1 Tax=Nocardia carnea TaxID=37328 RepID=UPI002453C071|nr:hypothetical protein [Nocardia carnea]
MPNPSIRTGATGSRVLGLVLLIWFVAGIVAAWQRGYFNEPPEQCSHAATLAVNIVAGPLNYMGLNPKMGCTLPQPSK